MRTVALAVPLLLVLAAPFVSADHGDDELYVENSINVIVGCNPTDPSCYADAVHTITVSNVIHDIEMMLWYFYDNPPAWWPL